MERTIEEVRKHAHPVLPNAENYSVIKCEYHKDFEADEETLIIIFRHQNTMQTKKIKFQNVSYTSAPFDGLNFFDYIMDTAHLGWESVKRIEVGDDHGYYLFWAESATIIE